MICYFLLVYSDDMNVGIMAKAIMKKNEAETLDYKNVALTTLFFERV